MLYTKEQVIEKTGASASVVQTWSQRLRPYPWMVTRIEDSPRIMYTDDFVQFITTRIGGHGPSALPDPHRVAMLYELRELPIDEIAETLGISETQILIEMQEIGLNYEKEE